jgi:hypothetical protein
VYTVFVSSAHERLMMSFVHSGIESLPEEEELRGRLESWGAAEVCRVWNFANLGFMNLCEFTAHEVARDHHGLKNNRCT